MRIAILTLTALLLIASPAKADVELKLCWPEWHFCDGHPTPWTDGITIRGPGEGDNEPDQPERSEPEPDEPECG